MSTENASVLVGAGAATVLLLPMLAMGLLGSTPVSSGHDARRETPKGHQTGPESPRLMCSDRVVLAQAACSLQYAAPVASQTTFAWPGAGRMIVEPWGLWSMLIVPLAEQSETLRSM